MSLLRVKILSLVGDGDWEGLYYRLNVSKLLRELGFFTGEDQNKMFLLLLRGS